jgi:hypothetical protein
LVKEIEVGYQRVVVTRRLKTPVLVLKEESWSPMELQIDEYVKIIVHDVRFSDDVLLGTTKYYGYFMTVYVNVGLDPSEIKLISEVQIPEEIAGLINQMHV